MVARRRTGAHHVHKGAQHAAHGAKHNHAKKHSAAHKGTNHKKPKH